MENESQEAPKPHYCGAVHEPGESCTIPEAPYYVTARDRFMSGWGQASGKSNLTVVPCADELEMACVLAYVKSRGDQENVRILTSKPRPRGRLLSNLSNWKKTAARTLGENWNTSQADSLSRKEGWGSLSREQIEGWARRTLEGGA